MSTKYNGLGLMVPFGVAALDRLVAAIRERRSVAPVLISSAVFAVAFAAVFSAGTFYIFIQPARFLSDVRQQSASFASDYGLGMPRGWIQHAMVTLPAAVGWPMYLAGVAGIVWSLVRDFRRAIVVFAFPIAYYIVAGNGYSVYARYMMPVVPFICLGAGYTCVQAVSLLMPDAKAWQIRAALISLVVLVGLPTAVKAIQIDRLLGRTDNRVVVARALESILPSGATIYQSGSPFGKAQLPPAPSAHTWEFDAASGGFGADAFPDWILIQRSPLVVYSAVPPQLPAILDARYTLIRSFPVGDDRPRVYDQQDAFYLPLAGLEGLDRPGPSFFLYEKK